MSVNRPRSFQSIRYDTEQDSVWIIDQTQLPHALVERELQSLDETCQAIEAMWVRGAPLIGVTAAFGVYLSLRSGETSDQALAAAVKRLADTRPTAVNLRWALDRVSASLAKVDAEQRCARALTVALELHAEDIAACAAMGEHGAERLEALWSSKCAAARAQGQGAPRAHHQRFGPGGGPLPAGGAGKPPAGRWLGEHSRTAAALYGRCRDHHAVRLTR